MKWKMLEERIDTRLLAQIRRLILELTDVKDAYIQFGEILGNSLYGEREETEPLEDMYGLRYPGEVLERYAEKIGDSPKIVRTLAMALAEMKPLLSNSMFVGTQYETFLKTVRKNAGTDIYCRGAWFLLEENPEKKAGLRKALWEHEWKDIMELLYLMSLFREDGLEKWKPDLARALGKERTIEVYGNQGLYIWIANHYAQKAKGYRKKEMNLLKAVCRLPLVNAEGTSPVKKWMLDAGYSEDEICFLNLAVLFGTELPERIVLSSITAERMALHACLRFLGSEEEYPKEVYELCTHLLALHESYEIKLDGMAGIFGSLKAGNLSIKSVGSYLALLPFSRKRNVPARYFWIDLTERKWDCLQTMLEPGEYRNRVIETLAEKNYPSETFSECVKKYEELTGEMLWQGFWTVEGYAGRLLFSKMAEKGMVDAASLGRQYLKDYQELPKEEWKSKWTAMLGNMRHYLFTLNNEESYGIFCELIPAVGIQKADDVLQSWGALGDIFGLDSYGWRYEKLHIVRECFNETQNRQLFYWAEQYVYENNPDHYADFLYAVLVSKKERAVLEQDEAAAAAKYMLEQMEMQGYKAQTLRNLYWTEEELAQYERQAQEQEAKKQEEEERQAKEKERQNFQKFLEEHKETALEDLSDFFSFKYGQRGEAALEISAGYLRKCCGQNGIHTTADGAVKLLRCFAELYKEKQLELEEIKKYINGLEVA